MFRSLFTTLRAKILTGYIIVIFIMICVMIWSLYNFNQLNESFRAIIVQNYSSIVAADNMVRSLDNQVNGLFLIFSGENTRKGETIVDTAKQDFFFWFEKARTAAYTKDEIAILDSLNDQYRVFLNEINFLMNTPMVYPKSSDHEAEYSRAIGLISGLKSQCYMLFETNHNFIKRAEERVESITRIAAFTMLFLAILGTVLSLVFSSKFSEFIVKPVKQLTRTVKHIAAGNFDQVIDTGNSDEIGILADEFNSMVGRLKKYEKLNINKMLYEKRKSEIIIESINDPVLMVDDQLRIMLANKAFNDELGRVEAEKTELHEVIKDEAVYSNIKSFVDDTTQDNQENVYRILDTEANIRYFKLRYSVINLPDSDVKATLVVFSDITNLKELDILKSEFVAKVSHELKTPLTSMGMAVGILGDGVAGDLNDKQKELIVSMRNDYDRLNRMVKDILELSRIESGGIKLHPEPMDVGSFLKECVKSFSLQSKENGIKLTYATDGDIPPIYADHDVLMTAVGNFIGNSVKFTQKGGEINLSAVLKGDQVLITIADNGPGINPEYLDKIFDKFVQVSGSRPGSVGLGLTIAKEIIELHHGSINVWSKPGHGTRFEITIPVRTNE